MAGPEQNVTINVSVNLDGVQSMVALADVLNERQHQINDLGYDAAHDDLPTFGLTHLVGQAYARIGNADIDADSRQKYVEAAALLVAAIEHIDRQVKKVEAVK